MIKRISAVIACSLLPFLYGFGWYGIRSTLYVSAGDHGVNPSSIAGFTALGTAGGAVGAAVLGLALGASGVAAVGLSVAVVGAALLASGLFVPGVIVLSLGAGLFRSTPVAIAARPFAVSHHLAVASVAVWVYLGFNAAGLVAAPVAGWLRDAYGPSTSALFALAFALGALVAGVDALVQWLAPDDAPIEAPDLRYTGAAFVLAAMVAAGSVVSALASNAAMRLAWSTRSPAWWVDLANPAAVIGLGVPVVLALAALAFFQRRAPLLLVGGIGAVLTGLLVAARALAETVAPSDALGAVGGLASGAVEVVTWPLLQAVMLRGVHWRASVAVAAIPSGALALVWLAPTDLVPDLPIALTASGLLVMVGVVMAVAAIPLERWLAAPPASSASS
jgi:hypothetical protein